MGPVPGIPGVPGSVPGVPGMMEQQGGAHYGRGGMINPQHHLEMNGSSAGSSMIPGIYYINTGCPRKKLPLRIFRKG